MRSLKRAIKRTRAFLPRWANRTFRRMMASRPCSRGAPDSRKSSMLANREWHRFAKTQRRQAGVLPEHRAEEAAAREACLQRDLSDRQRCRLQQTPGAAESLQPNVARHADTKRFDELFRELRVGKRRQGMQPGRPDARVQVFVDVFNDTGESLRRSCATH